MTIIGSISEKQQKLWDSERQMKGKRGGERRDGERKYDRHYVRAQSSWWTVLDGAGG